MIDEQTLSKIIGASVGTYPNEVADFLVRNKVIAPAPNYTIDQLVDGVFIGLNQNPTFALEYGSWVEQIVTTLTF
jgi:proteasome lid subunit RPN8/RPN11